MRMLLAVLLVGLAPLAAAQSNEGTAGAQFLKLGSSARAGAMGDAYTAVSDDAYAVHYNPAGMTRLAKTQLGGGHTSLFQKVTYQSFALAVPYGKEDGYARHAIGFGVLYLGVADIERRAGDTTDPIGSFSSSDAAYAFSYAHSFTERFSAGASAKLISQSIDSYRGSTYAGDLGLMYRTGEDKNAPMVGAAIKHLGKRIGYVNGHTDPLPTTISLGGSFKPAKPLLVSLEAGKAHDATPYGALGLEGRKQFAEDGLAAALRFGYNSSRRELGSTMSGISAGAGLSFPKGDLDLAWIPFGPLGDSFRFTLLVKF